MDDRARFAVGGGGVLAASVAVVAFVAATNALALAPAAGQSIGAPGVVLPRAVPVEASTTEVPPVEAIAPPRGEAVTVPAPEPVVVRPAEVTAADEDALVAATVESGSWDSVHAWAREHGWSADRTEVLIERLTQKVERAADRAQRAAEERGRSAGTPGEGARTHTSPPKGGGSEGSSRGSGKDRSRESP